jgi:hypothetical protein
MQIEYNSSTVDLSGSTDDNMIAKYLSSLQDAKIEYKGVEFKFPFSEFVERREDEQVIEWIYSTGIVNQEKFTFETELTIVYDTISERWSSTEKRTLMSEK